MNSKTRISLFTAFTLIIFATLYRVFPHPHNFAPITGVALFGGAVFKRKALALALPLLALYLGDLIINNTIARQFFSEVQGFVWFSSYMVFNFIAFALIALVGFVFIKKMSFQRILGGALVSSVLFFVITNMGSWLTTGFYPRNMVGLSESFIAGLPFFQNTLLGDLVFTFLLFGIYKMVMNFTNPKVVANQV